MKQTLLTFLLGIFGLFSFAQQDTTTKQKVDTIRVGGITIIKTDSDKRKEIRVVDTTGIQVSIDTLKVGGLTIIGKGISQSINEVGKALENLKGLSAFGELKDIGDKTLDMLKKKKPKKVSTNWFVWDLGFAGYNDKTNYATSEAQNFLHDQGIIPASKGDFAVKGSRISNFNLWFFMQRVSIAASVLNLKYGLGIESNNYFFKSDITYVDGLSPYTIRGNSDLSKNKLVANYLTIPLMINVNTNPRKGKKGFQLSAGISGGYLYSSKQKQKGSSGTTRNKTDFNLERWKLSYVGELGLGPVKLYGSMATTKLHQYGLDQHPYTIGVRFSN